MGSSDFISAAAHLRALTAPGEAARRPGGEVDDARRGAVMPEHPMLRALLGALMAAGPAAASAGWRRADGGAQITQRVGFDAIRVRLHADDPDAAWREVCAISPLALDVLVMVVDRFVSDGGEVRVVRCNELLDAKGCRRWGEERHALAEQIGRELMRLGRFTVGADEEPLFSVTPMGEQSTSFVVSLEPRVKAIWAQVPTRRLNWRLLQFDHRLNRDADVLAKKMGLYFSLAGVGSGPVVRSVRSVLKGVGRLDELSSGRGGRVADRFEEAALRLEEHGLFTVAYRRPDARSMLDGRVKGWVKRWADAEIVVTRCG